MSTIDLELRSPCQPRSITIWSTKENTNQNPFENIVVSSPNNNRGTASTTTTTTNKSSVGVLFGTERGSLHYRAYAVAGKSTSSSGRVDLSGVGVGPVVRILRGSTSNFPTPTFLILIDDSSSQKQHEASAAAAAVAVEEEEEEEEYELAYLTLRKNHTFAKKVIPHQRACAAAFHENTGFVIASGHSVTTLAAEDLEETKLQHYYQFNHANLPGVVRSFTLVCEGRVAVVAIQDSFYAIPAWSSNHHLPTTAGTTSSESMPPPSPAILQKVGSFPNASQHHTPIVVELCQSSNNNSSSKTQTIAAAANNTATSILFLACGRECAVAEILHDPRYSRNIMDSGSISSSSDEYYGLAINYSAAITPISSLILSAAYVALDGDVGVAILTSDSLVHFRKAACISVTLSTIEVGSRPNDFFHLLTNYNNNSINSSGGHQQQQDISNSLLAISYSGDAKLIVPRPDSLQDHADRLMRLAIDAFGPSNFPRINVAEAIGASFSSTSYVGIEPTMETKMTFKSYLEALLGLGSDVGEVFCWLTQQHYITLQTREVTSPFKQQYANNRKIADNDDVDDEKYSALLSENTLSLYLCATALLTYVCSLSNSPQGSLAVRAARVGASKVNETVSRHAVIVSQHVADVCEDIADRLIKAVSGSWSLLSTHTLSQTNNTPPLTMDFVEAALWLLRSCSRYEKALSVLLDRMEKPQNAGGISGGWSVEKYESYTARLLSELWANQTSNNNNNASSAKAALQSPATQKILEVNPQLGLSIFTSSHPSNSREWALMRMADDPLLHSLDPMDAIDRLKKIKPHADNVTNTNSNNNIERGRVYNDDDTKMMLPFTSGKAIAVAFIESAIGLSSNREVEDSVDNCKYSELPSSELLEDRSAIVHEELAYILIEGVVAQSASSSNNGMTDSHNRATSSADDPELGILYRKKLRRFLGWPLAKYRPEKILASLPPSLLREHALVLGRLGRHEEALRILYCDLKSYDLALSYCDDCHQKQKSSKHRNITNQNRKQKARVGTNNVKSQMMTTTMSSDCSYIPFINVALNSSSNKSTVNKNYLSSTENPVSSFDPSDEGIKTALRVMSERRDVIDKGAALRLLPKSIPVSILSRSFLIPSIVESESLIRRLTIASSILKARYTNLKHALTEAQLQSQAVLENIDMLKKLDMGPVISSSKPMKWRSSNPSTASPYFPNIVLTKYFYQRHLVVQAQVSNIGSDNSVTHAYENDDSSPARILSDVAFVVAESSDEAAVSTAPVAVEIPLKLLPSNTTGSAWCALSVFPSRFDGTVVLTCELRYTVLPIDMPSNLLVMSTSVQPDVGRTFVEELQDIELRQIDFQRNKSSIRW